MTSSLRPDGRPVVVGDVTIVSPGLKGLVDVFVPGAAGLRGSDSAQDALVEALDVTGMQEQVTVVIHDHSIDTTVTPVRARSADAGGPGLSVTVRGPGTGMGQVLMAVDEAGFVTWALPDDIPVAESTTRGGDSRTYTVPLEPAEENDSGKRGLLAAVGKRVLKVLAFRLLDAVAGEVANRFAARWEERARPYRLRSFGPDDYLSADAPGLTVQDLAGLRDVPALLFVHGELTLCHSCFGSLPVDVLRRLADRYQGRVLAFDHPTVSLDPTANAAWLADMVRGAGLVLDVVGHSRGGLVARMLAEQPGRVGLQADSLRVRRLVMVATPNQGTALADGERLAKYVERVTNLLEFVPDTGIVDVLTIVIEVVKQIAVGAYDGLEGIAAMKPGGVWLTELNTATPSATAPTTSYFAVASNYAPPPGSPLLRIARDKVTDLVFGEAGNDLIVAEQSVYGSNGGSLFPVADPVLLTADRSVDHSSYWSSPAVHSALENWLQP
jgi:pimeloyl-ACP methyl ester carboxylesterase